MQFTQPGFCSYGQPFAFNIPFQFNGYPEVVGEGNVTSVMSPDGSMQLLFLPTTQWWRPYPCNISVGNVNHPNWNPTGAWFIRSVFSPIQPLPSQLQPFQSPRTYSSDCCVNQPACQPPNFELKFHNDICTSTSDIHYFYPSSRACDWLKKSIGCAAVQVDVPMTNSFCHYEVICKKPCNCTVTHMDETENTAKVKHSCGKTSDTSVSEMSCDSDKSEKDCRCYKDKEKKSRKEKKKSKVKKTTSKVTCECKEHKTAKKPISNVICECKEQKTTKETSNKVIECKELNNTDKCVTTYTDEASGCAADKGQETQTADKGGETQINCKRIPVRKVRSGELCKKQIKQELWTPKTPTSKKAMKTKSSAGKFEGVCESGCCSGSCSCHSDTD